MDTWISFRNLLDNVTSGTEYAKLDLIGQRLLEWIAVRNQREEPLYVQEIVMKSEVASPATIHKGIASLERDGWITLVTDSVDSRRRIVKISSQAERLLAKLSRGVDAWVASQTSGALGRKSKTFRK